MPHNHHKFHSFSLKGRDGYINFLGSEFGPKGTTIVLDYENLIALVEAIRDNGLLSITEQPVVRPRHLTLVTGSGDPRNGAWSTSPHPAHHPHKQEGA